MAKSIGLIAGGVWMAVSQALQAETSLTIRAVIIAPPPCVINGGSTLDVPFGNDLLTSRVDGVNYRRGVPYTVTCDSPFSNALSLELKGTAASFDNRALATRKADLGVRLFVNGADWPLNTAVNFTYPNFPVVQAVPVKRAGSTLTGGAFDATATLVVDYQ
ncbi:fimbrial protein [Pseudomonas fluorescens]|jgi:type 1 fimbria pilin|uniref:Exotoxin n=1 Tax=Pseudomonas fluorescens TaxID=294 RepID=A0A2N1EE42_PSEFL|nr:MULTISPECIES: fimbrial protein [Pseudomonas]MBD8097951.1 fimbrial protein [Pseudomonas fluorescens]MBD8773640.1 fimbrial protein [Pseudomonas fluorescens]MBD8777886.1 fimbrial protein [Pseudomonas fluorescens]MBD8793847.1 fimbrial protein [Pseudomonas fluorescens]PKH25983.1 exotoxin [Pseudomonas fluorescens]